jgi:hypothetical protein
MVQIPDQFWKTALRKIKGGARKTIFYPNGSYHRGRKETISVSITFEDLKNQFEIQKGLCFWFNKPMDHIYNKTPYHPLAISVDRLDNDKGYDKDNIVLCYRFANIGRGRFPSDEFAKLITFLAE